MREAAALPIAQPIRPRFAKPSLILAFVGAVVMVLVIFFPRDQLKLAVYQQQKASFLTLNYLEALTSAYPNDRMIQLLLAKQQLLLGEWQAIPRTLKGLMSSSQHDFYYWQAHYYEFRFEIQKWYAQKINTNKPVPASWKPSITRLLSRPILPQQVAQLGILAAGFGQPRVVQRAYQLVLQNRGQTSAKELAQLAVLALGYSDYSASSSLYWLAFDKAPSLALKRQYFLRALRVLQAANQLDSALAQGKRRLKLFKHDKVILMRLSQLALLANHTKLAEQYIHQALRISR